MDVCEGLESRQLRLKESVIQADRESLSPVTGFAEDLSGSTKLLK